MRQILNDTLFNDTGVLIQSQIDNSVNLLNNILLSAAKKTFSNRLRLKTSVKTNKKKQGKNWFNKECMKHRKAFRSAGKLLSKSPFNMMLRKRFLERRAAYKKVCRKSEKNSRQRLTNQLLELGKTNPRTFWTIIERMNNWGKEKSDPADKISADIWKKHFKALLNGVEKASLDDNIGHRYSFEPVLDGIITTKELKEALNSMKNQKSPGPDEILKEYLKIFDEIA